GKAAATFDRVRTFLDYNYTRPIGRGELAERFGLNANYLSELFRRMGGCGVREYIEARRFEMARRLLRTTELPVKTVAEHCGFSGEVYFIRRFRELHGRPPGRYRIEQNS
ncbi:MAG TPA: AraC family transcriptional regulator, partial [Lentisphaeria bacterium]|nr:AraC family transcriptional regulator [Lentisphaeria bacterium]